MPENKTKPMSKTPQIPLYSTLFTIITNTRIRLIPKPIYMNSHYLDDTDELFHVMQGHGCVCNAITAGKYSLNKVLFFLCMQQM